MVLNFLHKEKFFEWKNENKIRRGLDVTVDVTVNINDFEIIQSQEQQAIEFDSKDKIKIKGWCSHEAATPRPTISIMLSVRVVLLFEAPSSSKFSKKAALKQGRLRCCSNLSILSVRSVCYCSISAAISVNVVDDDKNGNSSSGNRELSSA
ncbi:unnamed protein product [Onchocerca flexuosa]|uniref:SHSP domain-containing protein n=1 Tax=Onchocerca flexuosa TaxID=387005 RepID=A0A183I0V2_9BILA|nr:unnamed protein product [Onchocerca flexuosa]